MSQILHYYASGNTALGFKELLETNIKQLKLIYLLQGDYKTPKDLLIRGLFDALKDTSLHIELIHNPKKMDSYNGLILRDLMIGIIDEEAFDFKSITTDAQIIQIPSSLLTNLDIDKVNHLKKHIEDHLEQANQSFEIALSIHDEWERVYIKEMDFIKANTLTEDILYKLIQDQTLVKEGYVYERFMGAATPNGANDFIENLTLGLKRYFLKGRPGSGKSTLLKKLVNSAKERGFEVESYHCGFDPNSLDMVIIREANVCIFDSTSPHEYFPTLKDDEIIDLYELLITPNTDELNEKKLDDIIKRYKERIRIATNHLLIAQVFNDELEGYYASINKLDLTPILQQMIQLF